MHRSRVVASVINWIIIIVIAVAALCAMEYAFNNDDQFGPSPAYDRRMHNYTDSFNK